MSTNTTEGMGVGIQAGDLRHRHPHPSPSTEKSGVNSPTSPRIRMVVDESGFICAFDDLGNPIMPKKTARSFVKSIMDVFLPAGYPYTVTPDYTPYQIYVCCYTIFHFLHNFLRHAY